jgi:nucleotide-binding universal stress UspA family protein
MYRSILVPLDGSPFSEHALPLALSIARRAGATLQLAHVHTTIISLYGVDGLPVLDATLDIQMRESERAYLDGMARRLSASWDIPITSALLDGPTVDEAIHSHAQASGIDLVVMTTHGRGGLARAWLGSVADTLVRHVSIPILLVRPHDVVPALLEQAHPPILTHILVPLDGSALAEQILSHALALGTAMRAEYTLLQAIEPVVLGYAPAAYAAGLDDRLMAEARAEAQIYLDQVAAPLRNEALRVRTQVVVGPPAPAILDYARAHSVDLIAMATHGRGGVARMLLGSVADKVVRLAKCAVMLVRPERKS